MSAPVHKDDAVAIESHLDPNIAIWARDMRPAIQDSDSLPSVFKFAPNSASYKVNRYGSGTQVYLYGTDEEGHSVGVRAHGFRPYLYLSLNPIDKETTDEEQRSRLINMLIDDLQARLLGVVALTSAKWSAERVAFCSAYAGKVVCSKNKQSAALVDADQTCKPIVDWEITSGVPVRGSGPGYGYRGMQTTRFLKLYFYSPNLVSKCRSLLQREHAALGTQEELLAVGQFRREEAAESTLQNRAKKAGVVLPGRQTRLSEFCPNPLDNEPAVEEADEEDDADNETDEIRAIMAQYQAEEQAELNYAMDVDDDTGEGDSARAMQIDGAVTEADEDASGDEGSFGGEEREPKWYNSTDDNGEKRVIDKDDPIYVALERRLELRFRRRVNRLLADVRNAGSPLYYVPFDVFEADIDFTLRFAIDCGFSYEQWINIDMAAVDPVTGADLVTRAFEFGGRGYDNPRRQTYQQIELHCHYKAISFDENDPLQNTLPKHVILSVDGEMQTAEDGSFPDPKRQKVFVLSCIVPDERVIAGRPARPPDAPKYAFWYRSVSFALGASVCDGEKRVGCWDRVVFHFQDEAVLFRSFAEYVRQLGPTIVTGYNTDGFDLPYLKDRSAPLGCGSEYECAWGRSRLSPKITIRKSNFESSAVGNIEFKDVRAEGVSFVDLFIKLKKDPMVKLRSLSLNFVAAHYLGEQKEDVAYSRINGLAATVAGRETLRYYCEKDALLPLLIMAKNQTIQSMIEMARINVCSMHELLKRGQQIRSKCCIYRDAAQESPPHRVYTRTDAERRAEMGGTFEGAGVIEPAVGLYGEPIATLDFNSLYPSIMQTFNFCFSTVLAPDYNVHADPYLMQDPNPMVNLSYEERCRRERLAVYTVEECKTMEPFTEGTWEADEKRKAAPRFLRHHMKVGLVTRLIQKLLKKRDAVKKMQRQAADDKQDALAALFEERQLQIKLLANSIYGLFGATSSFGYCPDVSASVTCRGRALLYKMRYIVMTDFVEHKPRVVYGDTDSIFVHLPLCATTKQAAELAVRMAAHITARMKADYCREMPEYNIINLEFEKVFRTFLLLAKKKYAGLKEMYSGKDNSLTPKPGVGIPSVSGLETKRRDTTLLIGTEIMHMLAILLDFNYSTREKMRRAREYIWRVAVRPLLDGSMNLHKLIITRQLRMLPRQYAAAKSGAALPIHVQLAAKLIERAGGEDQPNAPRSGDRLAYVVRTGEPDEPVSKRAEDPVYALENNVPIDGQYYLDKHVRASVLRLYTPIVSGLSRQQTFGKNSYKDADAAEREAAEYVFGHQKLYVDAGGDPNEVIKPATLVKEEKEAAERAAKRQVGVVPQFSRRTGVPLKLVRYKQERDTTTKAAVAAETKPVQRAQSSLFAFSTPGARCRACGKFEAGAQRGFLCAACVAKEEVAAQFGQSAKKQLQRCLADIEDLRSERVELAATCHQCMGCEAAPAAIVCPNSECSVFWQRRYNQQTETTVRSRLRVARQVVEDTQ